jgi:histone demethylase JARID1
MPLSARRSEALDLNTVERRGQPNAAPEITKRNRLHNIPEGPTFRPTEEEFRDPMEYMRKIAPEGRKYGIAKIIPPEGWQMPFAIDTEVRHIQPSDLVSPLTSSTAIPLPSTASGAEFCRGR